MPARLYKNKPSVLPEEMSVDTQSIAPVINNLGQLLSNFLGQQMTLQQQRENFEFQQQTEEIKYSNQLQKQQAISDVLMDKPIDLSLQGDRDYWDTVKKTKAEQSAFNAVTKFQQEVAPGLLPTSNFDQELNTFISSEMQNQDFFGTGDTVYDTAFSQTLFRESNKLRQTHQLNSIKHARAESIATHQSVVSNVINTNLTGKKWQDLAIERQKLLPFATFQEISSSLWTEALAAARTPETKSKLSTAIFEKEFGDGKKSFYELNPMSSDKILHSLHSKYQRDITVQGQQEYDNLASQIETTGSTTDLSDGLEQLVKILHTDLPATFDRYGGNERYQSLLGKTKTQIEKLGQKYISPARYSAIINGQLPFDSSELKKLQPEVLKHYGIDLFKQPENAAALLADSRVLNDDIKTNLNTAMIDPINTEHFSGAYRFFKTIEDSKGQTVLSNYLDNKSRVAYEYVRAQDLYKNLTPQQAAIGYKEIAERLPLKTKNFNEYIGEPSSTHSEAKEKLWKSINSKINPFFSWSPKIKIPLEVKNDIINFTADYISSSNGSISSDLVNNALEKILPSINSYPGPSGSTMLGFGDIKFDPSRDVKFGTSVLNPETGKTEDTIKTFHKDMEDLQYYSNIEGLPERGLFYDDLDKVHVDPHSIWASTGTYLVKSQGNHIYMTKDQIDFKNPRLLAVPYPNDNSNTGLYLLGYKPGFKEKLKTIKEKQKEFQQLKTSEDSQSSGEWIRDLFGS